MSNPEVVLQRGAVVAQNGLRFPKRAFGGAWAGKLVWGALNHSRVLGILYNPAYAGAYVFGRYRDQKRVDSQGLFIHHTVRLPREDWEVLIPDHHPGYITWEEYEKNLQQLHSNRTNLEKSGPARKGMALLQGLIICGKCGRRMSVRYTGNGGISSRYECKGRWEHGNRATCTSVPALGIDQAVAERLLQAIQPTELELALQVMDKLLCEEDEADKGWKLSLERAQYEADRAERQYQQVEPENRLVARSLEARWNEKLSFGNSMRSIWPVVVGVPLNKAFSAKLGATMRAGPGRQWVLKATIGDARRCNRSVSDTGYIPPEKGRPVTCQSQYGSFSFQRTRHIFILGGGRQAM